MVFDEADELFSNSFSREINRVMKWARFIQPVDGDRFRKTDFFNDCQVMMFAADFDDEIEKNAKLYFRNHKTTVKVAADTGRVVKLRIRAYPGQL